MESAPIEITKLLVRLGKGDRDGESELIEGVFQQLRRVARNYMRSERPEHTLQPTALVNEAYLRIRQIREMNWESRSHFFGVAARVMRQVLVDHARAHLADKRPQGKISLDDVFVYSNEKSAEVVALDEALSRLTATGPRAGQVVELRFFTGLKFEEIAVVLGVAEKTAKRDWQFACAWLHAELSGCGSRSKPTISPG